MWTRNPLCSLLGHRHRWDYGEGWYCSRWRCAWLGRDPDDQLLVWKAHRFHGVWDDGLPKDAATNALFEEPK